MPGYTRLCLVMREEAARNWQVGGEGILPMVTHHVKLHRHQTLINKNASHVRLLQTIWLGCAHPAHYQTYYITTGFSNLSDQPTVKSSHPFYDYPTLSVVRSTAEMGTNETVKEGDIETALNEAYASTAKEGDIETAPNEAYASIAKEWDIETAPNEAYASIAKEGDIETTPNEAYASIAKEGDIETAPNEAYASIAKEGDIETAPNEAYASIAKEGDIETTPNEAYASIAKEGDIETAPNEAYASIAKEGDIETAPNEAYASIAKEIETVPMKHIPPLRGREYRDSSLYLHCEGRGYRDSTQ